MPDTLPSTAWSGLRAADDGDKPMVIDTDEPDHLCRTRRHDSRPGRGVHRGRSRQGQPRRADHAQLCAVGTDRRGADAHRRGAGAAEHAAAAAGTRRATARRLRAVPRGRAGVPRPPLPRRPANRNGRHCPRCREVWPADRLPQAARRTRVVDAVAETVTPSDTLAIMFTSGSSGPPKGVIHSHGNALGAVQLGSRRAVHRPRHPAVPADAVLLGGRLRQRCAVGAAGRRHPGHRTDSHSRRPRCDCWRGSVSRCFAAGPTRPKRWHAKRTPSQPICRRCDPAAWRRCYQRSNGPSPGRGRKLFGMTESFGPYCGYRRRHRYAAVGMGKLRKAVRGHGGSHRRPRQRRAAADGRRWE